MESKQLNKLEVMKAQKKLKRLLLLLVQQNRFNKNNKKFIFKKGLILHVKSQ